MQMLIAVACLLVGEYKVQACRMPPLIRTAHSDMHRCAGHYVFVLCIDSW